MPPWSIADARLCTYRPRAASSKTWNTPESTIVRKRRPRRSSARTSPTRNCGSSLRSAAFSLARAIAVAEMSMPTAVRPRDANSSACSPVPQPLSSTGEVISP
jgi:hypothetical protein